MVDSKYTSTLRTFVWQEALPGLSFVIQRKLGGTVYDRYQQMRTGDLENTQPPLRQGHVQI